MQLLLKQTKHIKIGESAIPNAGLGVFLMEDVKEGDLITEYPFVYLLKPHFHHLSLQKLSMSEQYSSWE